MKIEYVINLISDDVHESLSMWTTVFCYSFSLVICQGVFRSERVASRSPRTGCKLEVPRCSSYDGWLTVFEGRHRSVGFARILSTEKFWFWTRNCPWIPTGRNTHWIDRDQYDVDLYFGKRVEFHWNIDVVKDCKISTKIQIFSFLFSWNLLARKHWSHHRIFDGGISICLVYLGWVTCLDSRSQVHEKIRREKKRTKLQLERGKKLARNVHFPSSLVILKSWFSLIEFDFYFHSVSTVEHSFWQDAITDGNWYCTTCVIGTARNVISNVSGYGSASSVYVSFLEMIFSLKKYDTIVIMSLATYNRHIKFKYRRSWHLNHDLYLFNFWSWRTS